MKLTLRYLTCIICLALIASSAAQAQTIDIGMTNAELKKQLPRYDPSSLHTADTAESRCDILLAEGDLYLQQEGEWEASYDSLSLFLQQCPFYVGGKYNGAVEAWREFPAIATDVPQMQERGPSRFPDFLSLLKKVLYENPDTNWYCSDVYTMFNALQSADKENDQATRQAIAQYIVENNRCPNMASDFATMYNTGSYWHHVLWQDTVKDSIATPYDTTIPTLEQVGLGLLRGQQAGVNEAIGPIAATALGWVHVADNPFDADLSVTVGMNKAALVMFELRDILGRSIPLENAHYRLLQLGDRPVSFATADLPAGTYYLRVLTDGGEAETVKVVKR